MKRNLMRKSLPFLLTLLIVSCSATKDKTSHALFTSKKEEVKYINAYNNSLKLWPVAYEEKYVPTSFGTAHIIVSGPASAEPLVLLHGMDATSTMWYPNVKDFTKNYRIYAIDYIMEPGKSALNENKNLSHDEIVTYYNEIFNGLSLKKFNLLGTSRGGWIATLYTLKHQENIKKLALLAPVQTFCGIKMNSDLVNAANFKVVPNRKRLKKLVNDFSLYPEKIDPAVKEQMYLGTKYSRTKLDLFAMQPFKDEELKTITIPVLVLVGDHDILNPIEIVKLGGEKIPGSEGAVIETAGHFLTIDRTEEVDKRVLDFLKG